MRSGWKVRGVGHVWFAVSGIQMNIRWYYLCTEKNKVYRLEKFCYVNAAVNGLNWSWIGRNFETEVKRESERKRERSPSTRYFFGHFNKS